MMNEFDAVLVVSFGGPEKPEDVVPFLENVTKGRNISQERLLEVAEHYYHFGGKSPINDQNRALIGALAELFDREGPRIPVYWGNRNWHPFLADTVRQMRNHGVRRGAAFFTSAYGSYSGCRQYVDDIERARADVGEGAPEIYRLPMFNTHPGFIGPLADSVSAALSYFSSPPPIAFTAHSVPKAMADTSPYVRQIKETCVAVAAAIGSPAWRLVYQSRSGPPSQPWLEPDILDYIREIHAAGTRELLIVPVGFISDHMEVIYDLDTEAGALCADLGIRMVRAKTVGTAPEFVKMIRDLVCQGPYECPADCCPAPRRVVTATR